MPIKGVRTRTIALERARNCPLVNLACKPNNLFAGKFDHSAKRRGVNCRTTRKYANGRRSVRVWWANLKNSVWSYCSSCTWINSFDELGRFDFTRGRSKRGYGTYSSPPTIDRITAVLKKSGKYFSFKAFQSFHMFLNCVPWASFERSKVFRKYKSANVSWNTSKLSEIRPSLMLAKTMFVLKISTSPVNTSEVHFLC